MKKLNHYIRQLRVSSNEIWHLPLHHLKQLMKETEAVELRKEVFEVVKERNRGFSFSNDDDGEGDVPLTIRLGNDKNNN